MYTMLELLVFSGLAGLSYFAIYHIARRQAEASEKIAILMADQNMQLLKHIEENFPVGGQPLKLFAMQQEAAERQAEAEREMEERIQAQRAERIRQMANNGAPRGHPMGA